MLERCPEKQRVLTSKGTELLPSTREVRKSTLLHTVYGCLHATMAELGNRDTNGTDHKAKNTYYVTLSRSSLLALSCGSSKTLHQVDGNLLENSVLLEALSGPPTVLGTQQNQRTDFLRDLSYHLKGTSAIISSNPRVLRDEEAQSDQSRISGWQKAEAKTKLPEFYCTAL